MSQVGDFIRGWRGDRQSLIALLDSAIGPYSREKAFAEVEKENAEQVRDAAEVRKVRLRKLPVEADGRDRHAGLHARAALCHEAESADGNDNDRDKGPSAQLERVPRMDENTQPEAVVSDAESVARTLDNSVAARRKKRKQLLAQMDAIRKEVIDLDHVIRVMEKAGRKLRE